MEIWRIKMNSVNIAGKVIRLNIKEKVAYMTLSVRNRQNYEYIDITDFSPNFIKQHISEGDYIAVHGAIHVNGAEHAYKVEIITESITLLGKQNNTLKPQNNGIQDCAEVNENLPWDV